MAKIRTLEEIAQILKKHRKELEEKYNVKHLKIFGSYAKGKQTENSDLDIIVTFKEVPTFFELLELEEYLEKLLGLKIDLLTEKGISPYIKPFISEVAVL